MYPSNPNESLAGKVFLANQSFSCFVITSYRCLQAWEVASDNLLINNTYFYVIFFFDLALIFICMDGFHHCDYNIPSVIFFGSPSLELGTIQAPKILGACIH